jgi:hypothetical protein
MLPFSDNPPGADRAVLLSGLVSIALGALTTQAVLTWSSLDASLRYEYLGLETLVSTFGMMSPVLTLWFFGLIPLAAGIAGMLLPLGRELVRLRENERRRARNARVVAGRRLLESGGELDLSCPEPLRSRSRAAVRRSLDEIAAEFGATISGWIGAEGSGCHIVYRFPRLAELIRSVDAARASLPLAATAEGDGIVFDSGMAEPPLFGPQGQWPGDS